MGWRSVPAWIAVGIVLAAACGTSGNPNGSAINGSGGNGGTGTGGSGGTGTGGFSGDGSTGGPKCTTAADCATDEICSTAGHCIKQGQCVALADCASVPGTFCAFNGTCIANGTCVSDADCGKGLVCDTSTSTCNPGGGCGGDVFTIAAVPPNMLIAIDRSCSMRQLVGTASKWKIAVDAINNLTTTFKDQIRWGLLLFPDKTGDRCAQDAPTVPVGPGNESAIQTVLTASLVNTGQYFPNNPCVTPIDTAMQTASQQTAFQDTTRKSFVVLMTDGKQAGCNLAGGDPGTTQIITDMNAAGISTFVVGFGAGVDPAQMNIFANAGGVPRNDPTTQYYQADDAATLQAALGAIAGSVIGCTFSLGSAPPDATKLYTFFNKIGVTRDPTHQTGWDYDAASNQITFYGTSCDELKNTKPQVDVVYGCNQAPPG